ARFRGICKVCICRAGAGRAVIIIGLLAMGKTMSLRRKFILRNLALLLGLCLLGGVALWGLSALRGEVSRAVYVYNELSGIEPAEMKLAALQGSLSSSATTDRAAVREQLDGVIEQVEAFTSSRA